MALKHRGPASHGQPETPTKSHMKLQGARAGPFRRRLALAVIAVLALAAFGLPRLSHSRGPGSLSVFDLAPKCDPETIEPLLDPCATIATPQDGGDLTCFNGNRTHPSGCSFDVDPLIKCSIPMRTMHLFRPECDVLAPYPARSSRVALSGPRGGLPLRGGPPSRFSARRFEDECSPCGRGEAPDAEPFGPAFYLGRWVPGEDNPLRPGQPSRAWRYVPQRACACGGADPMLAARGRSVGRSADAETEERVREAGRPPVRRRRALLMRTALGDAQAREEWSAEAVAGDAQAREEWSAEAVAGDAQAREEWSAEAVAGDADAQVSAARGALHGAPEGSPTARGSAPDRARGDASLSPSSPPPASSDASPFSTHQTAGTQAAYTGRPTRTRSLPGDGPLAQALLSAPALKNGDAKKKKKKKQQQQQHKVDSEGSSDVQKKSEGKGEAQTGGVEGTGSAEARAQASRAPAASSPASSFVRSAAEVDATSSASASSSASSSSSSSFPLHFPDDLLGDSLVAAFREAGVERIVLLGDSTHRQMFNGLVSALRRQATALDPAAQVSAHYALTRWSEDVAADVAWWSSPANEEAGKFDETIYQWGLDQLFSRARAADRDANTLFQVDFVGAGRFDMQTNELPRILNETVADPERRMPRVLVLAAVCFWHVNPSETDLPESYVAALDAALAAGARVGLLTCPTERVRARPDQLKAIAARNQVVRATVAEARAACRARDFALARAMAEQGPSKGRARGRGLEGDADAQARAAAASNDEAAAAGDAANGRRRLLEEGGDDNPDGEKGNGGERKGHEHDEKRDEMRDEMRDSRPSSSSSSPSASSSPVPSSRLPWRSHLRPPPADAVASLSREAVAAADAAAEAAAAAAVSAIAGAPTLLADESSGEATEANGWRPAVRLSERPPLATLLRRRRVFLVDVDAMTSSVPDPLIPDDTDYHYACWLHSSNGWSRGPILWVGTHTSTNRYYDRLRGPRTGLCDDCVNHAIWQQVARRLLAEPDV